MFFVLFKLRFFALESGVLQILFARSIPPPFKSFVDSPFPFKSNTFCAVYSPPIKQFLRGPFSLPPNYFLRGSCPIPPIFFVRFIPPSLIIFFARSVFYTVPPNAFCEVHFPSSQLLCLCGSCPLPPILLLGLFPLPSPLSPPYFFCVVTMCSRSCCARVVLALVL